MGTFIPCHPDCRHERQHGSKIDRIIIHRMEGSLEGTIAWFQTVRPSMTAAHFLVGLDGRVVQMAVMSAKVSHAGSKTQSGWNDRSIGIEFEGHCVDPWPEAQLVAGAQLIARDIIPRYPRILPDREHIIGHVEVPGATHTDPGEGFPWDEFMAQIGAAQ